MTLVETKLRNKIGYSHLHDCLVTYIERDFFFFEVDEDDTIETFTPQRKRRQDKSNK
jgi:hypothetical protein